MILLLLGQLLGFEDFIPSFINAQATDNIVNGVNYASGSAGILKETGKHLVRTEFASPIKSI